VVCFFCIQVLIRLVFDKE